MTPAQPRTHHTKIHHQPRHQVVVIGGGFSGLASAILLAKQGWQVTVLEKNATLGGRARVFHKKGFSFDMGPSWYMMPEVFDRFFAQCGRETRDFYEIVRLDPRYRVFFEGESSVTLKDEIAQNQAEFENIERGAGQRLGRFLSEMQRLYMTATQQLMYQNVWNPQTWISFQNLRAIMTVFTTLRLWETWQRQVQRRFADHKLQKILSFPAVFLGGSPFNTPSLYSLLAWSDFGTGIWYPKGGMIEVVKALETLALDYGVKILTNQEATSIEVADGQVTGVKTKTQHFPTRIVVGATDIPWLETQLLPREYQTYPAEYWNSKTLGISALMIYIGVNTRYRKLAHHNLYFTRDWQQNFQEIFTNQSLPTDPSFYISVRSVTDRSIVPKDSEEVVILVPLGSRADYDEKELDQFTQKVIRKAEKVLDISLTDHRVVKEVFTPKDFLEQYHAFRGTALGLAHTFRQSLWLRPHNRSRKVKGLFYAGQYTNPGVGVPMALVSAQLVAKMVGSAPNQSERIFKNGSTTYYYSSLVFRGQVKDDVFNLYAYVRVVDDFVDRLDPQIQEFEHLWQETQAAWKGSPITNEIVRQFIELAKRRKFEWKWIQAFWKAMRSDLTKKNYKNFSELEGYMYGSAEVIGLMMAKILDLPPIAMTAAAQQGKAMQFVNFIRDVTEDTSLGRNYLGYGKSIANNPEQWACFIRSQIDIYQTLQRQAETGYQYIPRRYRIPIKTAANIYEWTAQQIYQNPGLVWKRKVKPSKWRVFLYLVKNWMSE